MDELLNCLLFIFFYWVTNYCITNFLRMKEENIQRTKIIVRILFWCIALWILITGLIEMYGQAPDMLIMFILILPLAIVTFDFFRKKKNSTKTPPAPKAGGRKMMLQTGFFCAAYLLVFNLNDLISDGGNDPQRGIGKGLMGIAIVFIFFLISIVLTIKNYKEYREMDPKPLQIWVYAPVIVSLLHIIILANQ